jgi:hypothetical protein
MSKRPEANEDTKANKSTLKTLKKEGQGAKQMKLDDYLKMFSGISNSSLKYKP